MPEAYFAIPSTAGNYLESAPLSHTGDLEVVVKVKCPDYSTAGDTILVSQGYGSGPFWFILTPAGATYLVVRKASVTYAATGFSPVDGSTYWLRAHRSAATGAITLHSSLSSSDIEPMSWTALGSGTSPVGAIDTSSAKLTMGSNFSGDLYRVIVRVGGVVKFNTGSGDIPSDLATKSYFATTGQSVTLFRSGGILLPDGNGPILTSDGNVILLPDDSETALAIVPRTTGIVYGTGVPSISVINQFEANLVSVASWVDIYLSDNTTLWRPGVAITDGSVSVDMNRSERRNLDITMSDDNDAIGYGPGAFWYDKILKPYRGIKLSNGDTWVSPLGEFWADSISRPHFPSTIQASCRDASKKLIQDKFAAGTSFAAGSNVGTVIQTIAIAGGISKFSFTATASVLPKAASYAIGDERWAAMTDLAASIGFEMFFSAFGLLVFRPYVDPFTAGVSYTFRTGVTGNLIDFTRSTSDTYLFNNVVVYDSDSLVFGRATNVDPTSPTRVAAIGRRIKKLESSFLANNAAAASVATSYLRVSGLEQFDMNLDSLVVPWLEAGDAVELLLPDAAPGDPTRFLLTNFTIPLGLGSMSGTAKRVIDVA